MATDTLCEPNTLPTTVGMVEKKPPFAMPLITTNIARDASEVDAGHTMSIVKAFSARQRNSVLRAPILSQNSPHSTLPMADEKLNPARSPAPVEEDSPMDVL